MLLKKTCEIAIFLMILSIIPGFAQERTKINDTKAKKMLVGKHLFSLQWISWEYFGLVNVTEKAGVLYLKGEQNSRENDDFVSIDGVITTVDAKSFTFEGTIITKVSHINSGEECIREGAATFAIKGNRKYWRLQEMDNPCEGVVDYVDIFFRK